MKRLSGRTLSPVHNHFSLKSVLRDPVFWVVCAVVAGLAVKFLWPLVAYSQPLGYDTGIYRYLFIRHAQGFPPFFIADIDPWARGHPLGLFFFSTILMRLGVPADWLLGWVWNLFAVGLLCTLSWAVSKRFGRMAGVWTLVAALLSVSTFDGFAAMYWKTFASMLWMILAMRAIERRSWSAVIFGLLTVVTHHQTGLLFGLVIISYFLLPLLPFSFSTLPVQIRSIRPRDLLFVIGGGLLVLILGLLAYLPVWNEAIAPILPALLGETEAASGSFPAASFYLESEVVVLFFGLAGFLLNVRRERWTIWQLPVLWSALFIVLHLLFYRRFFLQMEFFLLPFVGIALDYAWTRWRNVHIRTALITLLAVQVLVMQNAIKRHEPMIDEGEFHEVVGGLEHMPDDAFVLGLENTMPVILRGWFPFGRVGGPGLFDAPWTENQWKLIILGSSEERAAILRSVKGPLYFFASSHFRDYYGDYANIFLHDACLERVGTTSYYHFICE